VANVLLALAESSSIITTTVKLLKTHPTDEILLASGKIGGIRNDILDGAKLRDNQVLRQRPGWQLDRDEGVREGVRKDDTVHEIAETTEENNLKEIRIQLSAHCVIHINVEEERVVSEKLWIVLHSFVGLTREERIEKCKELFDRGSWHVDILLPEIISPTNLERFSGTSVVGNERLEFLLVVLLDEALQKRTGERIRGHPTIHELGHNVSTLRRPANEQKRSDCFLSVLLDKADTFGLHVIREKIAASQTKQLVLLG
jgi:hypothetical protein